MVLAAWDCDASTACGVAGASVECHDLVMGLRRLLASHLRVSANTTPVDPGRTPDASVEEVGVAPVLVRPKPPKGTGIAIGGGPGAHADGAGSTGWGWNNDGADSGGGGGHSG